MEIMMINSTIVYKYEPFIWWSYIYIYIYKTQISSSLSMQGARPSAAALVTYD